MALEVLHAPAVGALPGGRRPGPLRLVGVLTSHNLAGFLRTPIAAFFTVIFPLSFLVIVGSTVGHEIVTDHMRVSQLLVAPFAVFGVAEATFVILATGTARLREDGVLKRLSGTPVPPWTVVAGRIAAAVIISLASVTLLTIVGVVGYDVQIIWRKIPAALLTVLLGAACFAALGLAVVALTRSVVAVQALTNGLLIPLAFISNIFIIGATLPTGLDRLSRALPLRHFADALQGTFDPLTGGTGFAWRDLAVLAGWAVVGAVVARWRFGWEPRLGERRHAPAGQPSADDLPSTGPAVAGLTSRQVGRPSLPSLLAGQVGYAVTALRRDKSPLFFSIVFPALLLVLFPVVFHHARVHGMRMADFLLPGMIVYAAAVAAYVNMTEQIAKARSAGVLKRLRGTPLPPWTYPAGRLLSAMLVSMYAAVVLLIVAITVNGSRIDAARLPAALLAIVLAAACFGALGLALLTLMSSAPSLTAITLGTLLPLTFLSDVFYLGADLPRPLQFIGDVLPLKHAVHALLAALRPGATGAGFAWGHLAVVAAWTLAALLVARRMPWQPRTMWPGGGDSPGARGQDDHNRERAGCATRGVPRPARTEASERAWCAS